MLTTKQMYSTKLEPFNLKDTNVEYGGLVSSKIVFDIGSVTFEYSLDFSPSVFQDFYNELSDFSKGLVNICKLEHWSGSITLEKAAEWINFEINIDDNDYIARSKNTSTEFPILKLNYKNHFHQRELESILEEFKYLNDWIKLEIEKIASNYKRDSE